MRNLSRLFAVGMIVLLLLGAVPCALRADEDPEDNTGADEAAEDGSEEEDTGAATLEISPESGPVGTKVYVTIENFEADQTVEVYFSDITDPAKTWPTDSDGYMHTGFRVPEYPTGRFRVLVNDGTNNMFVYFNLEPQIEAGATSGYVGDVVDVTGHGFTDDEDVTIYLDDVEMGTSVTNASGTFTATCTIPPSSHGRHTIKAEDNADAFDTVDFVTRQSVSIEPQEGTPSTEVTFIGSGFNADTDVSISFDDEEVDVVHTERDGSFLALMLVPGGASGEYEVKADDGEARDYAHFTLVSAASLSASSDTVGALITVSGTGFLPLGEAIVTYDANQVASSRTDSSGGFSITFSAPRSQHGEHEVVVSDGVNAKAMPFIMESSAPACPLLLGPTDGTKGGKQIYFDWEDAPDASGVVYMLQIAGDIAFSQPILTESSLLSSEFLLTEEQSLPRTGKDSPYFWRVKALDFAGNESTWSTPRTFQVGFVFEMPTWALYSLIGIGILLALFLGVWFLRSAFGHRLAAEDIPDDEFSMEDGF